LDFAGKQSPHVIGITGERMEGWGGNGRGSWKLFGHGEEFNWGGGLERKDGIGLGGVWGDDLTGIREQTSIRMPIFLFLDTYNTDVFAMFWLLVLFKLYLRVLSGKSTSLV